jgi:RNA polymerase sporulation-specific sigma factor
MIGSKNSFAKPLSKEEEEKYLQLVKKGDKEAQNILVKHNMRLVAHIAKKYSGTAETDDLISVGSIGLIKAIATYQQGKGTTLATYTARCIENEILMLIRSNKKHKNVVSLSDPVGTDKDGNELTLMDLLFEKEDEVFDKVESQIKREKLLLEIKRILTEREYKIICLRYALKGGIPLPQREVANILKISRSYISRIEKKAIEKLRIEVKRREIFVE